MQHITGISRQQMRFSSLENAIAPDNQVRFIDAFVAFLDLVKLGFTVNSIKAEGRPSYNTKYFLKSICTAISTESEALNVQPKKRGLYQGFI
jgi:transposase